MITAHARKKLLVDYPFSKALQFFLWRMAVLVVLASFEFLVGATILYFFKGLDFFLITSLLFQFAIGIFLLHALILWHEKLKASLHTELDSQMSLSAELKPMKTDLINTIGHTSLPKVKVVGVGSAGQNTVNRIIEEGIYGVEYIVFNTDAAALDLSNADTRVLIGPRIAKERSTGGDPEMGKRAAEESSERIFQVLKNADIVFITAGMGAGTGTGAAPVIAEIAKKAGALTIGIVTKPFTFEGAKRNAVANSGIEEMKKHTNTLIAIPNDRLLQIADRKSNLQDAFRIADQILLEGIRGMSDLIRSVSINHLDFSDVVSIMSGSGPTVMSVGYGTGENRVSNAVQQAVNSKLLDITIDGARRVLFNITGGPEMTLFDVNTAAALIREFTHPDVDLKFGSMVEEEMEGKIRLVLFASGFGQSHSEEKFDESNKLEKQQVLAEVWNNLGQVYFFASDYGDAVNAFQKAIEFDPEIGMLHANLKYFVAAHEKFSEAISEYGDNIDLVELEDKKALMLEQLGKAYRKLHDFSNAIKIYQQVDQSKRHILQRELASFELTDTELQFVSLLLEGKTVGQIAGMLDQPLDQVKKQVDRLIEKTGAEDIDTLIARLGEYIPRY